MNLDPSTGNPVESKRIADANKRAEEAYMKKMESLLGQDLYRMEVFTAEEEEEMEAIRALQEAERKGREAYDRMAKPEDRIPKAEGSKIKGIPPEEHIGAAFTLYEDGEYTSREAILAAATQLGQAKSLRQLDRMKSQIENRFARSNKKFPEESNFIPKDLKTKIKNFNVGDSSYETFGKELYGSEFRESKAEGSLMMPREKYGVGSKIAARIKKAIKGKTPEEQQAEIKAYVSDVMADTPQKTLDRLSQKEQRLITVGKTEKMFSNIGNRSRLDQAKEEIVVSSGGDLKQYEDYLDAQLRSVDDLAEKRLGEAENKAARDDFAEGSLMMPAEGMPVDTYDNIPPDEMDEALASQLPDNEMEDSYIDYILDESLDDSEQEYLADALQKDPRLEGILDKVMITASEFSGAGEVEGPGTGVSDSIPARLSDGEFVFTRKATDQLGADNLQVMMDDAERAYDGGYQMKAEGGMMDEEDPGISKTQEEIEKLMMGANRMPSLQ